MAHRQDKFSWLDVDDLGELLAERHREVDPWAISFTRLKQLVTALPEFEEEPGHPCNERILEEIQRAWIEERGGKARSDD